MANFPYKSLEQKTTRNGIRNYGDKHTRWTRWQDPCTRPYPLSLSMCKIFPLSFSVAWHRRGRKKLTIGAMNFHFWQLNGI